MGAPFSGKNGLVYISGTEITGANAWSLDITQPAIETPQFNDTSTKRIVALGDWSGTVDAWSHSDSKVITSAAVAGRSVTLHIYPDRSTLTAYAYGLAIFGSKNSGATNAPVARNGDFVGADNLGVFGNF